MLDGGETTSQSFASAGLGAPGGETVLAAVATRDPFHPRTFSGYSASLFSGIAARGVRVKPVATGAIRWYDVFSGAVNVRGLARGRFSGRYAPKINPAWFWSRAGHERATRRFNDALALLPHVTHVLQVGTHVRSDRPGTDSYCVADCTVVQALAAGEFSVSQAPRRIGEEAVECQREVFLACRKIFVLSRWTADSVERDYGVPGDRIVVVGAGANTPPSPPRPRTDEEPYILFVGFDWEQKGGPLLLEACRLLWREGVRLRLVIVGCRPPIHDDRVEVVGPLNTADGVQRDHLRELYAGARCLALLSAFETFGIVILEAGLMGVPVVSTRTGSRPETVIDGSTGVLVRERTGSAVADALRPLILDKELASTMGAAARAHVQANFTWPIVVDRVLAAMGVNA